VNAFRSRIALAEFDNGSGGKTKVRIAVSRALTEEEVRRQIEGGEIGAALSKDPSSYAVQPVTWPYERYVSDRAIPQLKRTAILIAAPIVSTLLLWLAIAWIRKGFKSNSA